MWHQINFGGLTEDQEQQWEDKLQQKGLIPYIRYPILCYGCGCNYPEFFMVSDEEWQHYTHPYADKEILCRPCYDRLKIVVDDNKVLYFSPICAYCGIKITTAAKPDGKEWEFYIEPEKRSSLICPTCYDIIKQKIILGYRAFN